MQKKLSNIEKAILLTILGGALIISPMGGQVVIALAKYYLKKWWEKGGPYIAPEEDPEQVRQSIYKLRKKDYIIWKYDKKKGTVVLKLTKKGRRMFDQRNFDDFKISPQEKWDCRWRFVLFDVPEKSRPLRDVLRNTLKNLGFFQFQKSVWLYPFECEREIKCMCEYFRIARYVMMFTVQIDNDRILRRYFLRQGILRRHHLSLLDKGVRY